jgi:hypothetical protein
MSSASQRQYLEAQSLDMPMSPASSWNRFAYSLADARNGLLIIGYGLAMRVLFLARRWNY